MPDEKEFIEEEYEEAVFSEVRSDTEDAILEASGWRLAKSLVQLRGECNMKAPNRKKGVDGTIGDSAHASSSSRHNPNNAGVVCALDITHDPANNMDTFAMFDYIRQHPHLDVEYVISNKRIASRSKGWTSRNYTGSNPHSSHIHVGVGRGPESEPYPPYDDEVTWGIIKTVPGPPPIPQPTPFPYGKRNLRLKKPQMTGNDVLWVQQNLNHCTDHGFKHDKIEEDGIFGKNTDIAVKDYQSWRKLEQDGIVGKNTWASLRKEFGN